MVWMWARALPLSSPFAMSFRFRSPSAAAEVVLIVFPAFVLVGALVIFSCYRDATAVRRESPVLAPQALRP
jgi:hypothetical protein